MCVCVIFCFHHHHHINMSLIASWTVLEEEEENNRRRRIWSQPWFLQRHEFGHKRLVDEFRRSPHTFRDYLKMSEGTYVLLLSLVKEDIEKENTVMRPAISAHDRLSATLRYLATGEKLSDLQARCNISRAALSGILPTTCRAIVKALRDQIQLPRDPKQWQSIARNFHHKCGFFPAVGAIDGKHVRIEKPPKSESLFYNYKGFFSIHLFAVVDADYQFLYCNIGANGSQADASVMRKTIFHRDKVQGKLKLPPNEFVAGLELQYAFLADRGFALEEHILVPYHDRQSLIEPEIALNFNKRLSAARRIVECVFGHLRHRFRIFDTSINMDLVTIDAVILATCYLHNFLRRKDSLYFNEFSHGVDGIYNQSARWPRVTRQGISITTQHRMTELRNNCAHFHFN